MYVMHIALGGCIKRPPISYGLTQDTGGHIAYVLGAASAQARLPEVSRVDILTRLIHDPVLGREHANPLEMIGPKLRILRLHSASSAYLAQEALEAELPALTRAFLDLLSHLPRKPDVLHCHFGDAAVLGAAARARLRIPMLYTPHSLAIGKLECLPGDCGKRLRLERSAIREADAIIASSRDEAERQVAAYDPASAGRVWRINPGISLPQVSDDDQAARLLREGLDRSERPFLLAIARPVPKKNFVTLLRAYCDDPDLHEAANLVILAEQDGAEGEQRAVRTELARLARALPGRVLLPARHEATVLPQLYRRAAAQGSVFVNPALHEAFGRTLIEAARFGLPAVATQNGALAEILSALGHGLLVDPSAPDQIGNACLRLIQNAEEWRRCSHNAQTRHRLFDWDAWADRVSLICRRLTQKQPPLRPTVLPQTLLAFDLDGTLTGCADSARRFARWTAGALSRNQHVVIATGRSLPEARRILADWSLPEPAVIITSVGAEIWRADRRGSLALCRDYADWISQDWEPKAILARLSRLNVAWQPAPDQRRWKISLAGTEDEAWIVQEALAKAGLAARVIPSHRRFIDILPHPAHPRAGAGHARPDNRRL